MKRNNSGRILDSGPNKIIETNSSIISMKCTERVVKHWAHTQSTLNKIIYTWTIDHFSFRQGKTGEMIVSPKFFSDVNDQIKWCLELFPNGKNNNSKDHLSLFLRLASSNQIKIVGKINFSVVNVDPTKTFKSVGNFKCFELYESWGISKLFERALILHEARGFLPENKLTIFCEVSFVSDYIDISSQKSIGQLFKVPECKITNDLANLLESQEFSDVTLIVDEYEFPAHKAILAARSEVFAAMFKHEMKERKSGRVTITDVNKDIFQEMLHFIYTEDAPKLTEIANHLLAAADKYALTKLKVMCEEVLFAELSIETAVETLVLADRHSAEQLKEQTINFITKHVKDIIQTSGWQNMINTNANSALLAETSEELFTQPKQHLPIP